MQHPNGRHLEVGVKKQLSRIGFRGCFSEASGELLKKISSPSSVKPAEQNLSLPLHLSSKGVIYHQIA